MHISSFTRVIFILYIIRTDGIGIVTFFKYLLHMEHAAAGYISVIWGYIGLL